MSACLQFKESNCKNCYKCIRNCPVKSISFSNHQANIISSDCILCGRCVQVCPQNAKEIRNDIPKAKELIAGGDPVYVSIAPSFVANYFGTDLDDMREILQKLGFADVYETAIGATLVKNMYDAQLENADGDPVISSCCHTINMLVEKYYPENLKYLSKVTSPMLAHCTKIKHDNPGCKVVFIGPCISKKDEAEQYSGIVDCVLTFEELTQWMGESRISMPDILAHNKKKAEKNEDSKTRLFPTSGGILRTMSQANKDYTYIAIDGMEDAMSALRDISEGGLRNCFIEMSACRGSCIGGPAMDGGEYRVLTDRMAVEKFAGSNDFKVDALSETQMIKDMPSMKINNPIISEKDIVEVLHKIGKTSPEMELNCGGCGYNTCREKAYAVLLGKADLTMCLPYLIEKAESFSDNIIHNTPNGIIVLNEKLEVQQLNSAACRILNIQDTSYVLHDHVVRILEPSIFFEVVENKRSVFNRRTYLAEYGKYVEHTVIYDPNYHIVISFMRDITTEAEQRERKHEMNSRAIEITDDVVSKQMRTVQEIASLLGETVAETKIALNSLKESLKDDE